MNILDWFKNKNDQQSNNSNMSETKKKFKISDWFTSTPTELDENGNPVSAPGVKPESDPYKVAIPLLLSYMAVKSPESGVPMLSGYLGGRQQQLEQQKEDAWKQWQIKANQKRQALEDERYKIEHPTYTVPTTTDLAKSSPVNYGQYVQNPMTTGVTIGGGFRSQDQLQNQINNLGQTNNQIPFLNFGQEVQPQQTPSLSAEAPEAQLRQPSRLDQFAGQTLPLNEVLRLQVLDEQAREKAKTEQEKKAERKAKIDSFSYYENLLPENNPSRVIIADAKKNPDAYNLDFAAKAYLESKSPKAQPVNVEGLNLPSDALTFFKNNPNAATSEAVLKILANMPTLMERTKFAADMKRNGLLNEKTEADIKKVYADIGKIGREGTNKKETAAEKTARLNDIIATAGQYRSYTDYIADLKRNSKDFISDFGSAAYQKAIKDAKGLPVWQKVVGTDTATGKPKESYGQGIAFRPNQISPMRQYFPNYVNKEQVKTTVQQPAKTKTLKSTDKLNPAITTAIKKAMNGKPEDVAAVAKKYGFKEDELYFWYKNHK